MEKWDEEKKQFIQKLAKMEGVFQEIFEKDKDGLVINYDEKCKLEELREKNNEMLHKLESREFKVAVVGLEKAGKSTLGNALIKSIVLPEYTQRCTYTTTEIRAGEIDEAEVFFYGYEEFNKKLRDMLAEVQYTGEADLGTINLNAFNAYWASVEANNYPLFQLHNVTTVGDIRTIIENKEILRGLLGQPSKKFVGQEEWKKTDFQIFITGIKDYREDSTVIRAPHPYAVKNVVIKSTQLGDMQHLVLYDVPGFDSPTQLHKKQTENMLTKADSIILVTNVGDRPDFNGPQLDILRKVKDEYGIRLSEKAFVFGNKVDCAENRAKAEGNMAALKRQASDWGIATENHVVCGSAKAYLQDLGLRSQDDERRGSSDISSKLKEYGMVNGVETLHQKMEEYYNNDRFSVLSRRAQGTLDEIVKFLREILEKYTPDVLSRLETGDDRKLLLNTYNTFEIFRKEAYKISQTYQEQIKEERPFSTRLENDIEKIYPPADAFLKELEDAENNSAIDTDNVYPVTHVDASWRNSLQTTFVARVVQAVAHDTGEKQQAIRDVLVDKFLEVVGMEPHSSYKEELVEGVNQLFDELLLDGAKCYFNPLVERFTTSLIETLIKSPFAASDDRLNKVNHTLPELLSLAVYYVSIPPSKSGQGVATNENGAEADFDPLGNPDEFMKMFSAILAHEGLGEEDTSEDEGVLKQFFNDNRDIIQAGISFAIDNLPIPKWGGMLVKAGFDLNVDQPKLEHTLENAFYKEGWDKKSREDREAALEEAIVGYCLDKQASRPKPVGIRVRLAEMHERAKQTKSLRTKEDIIKTLDADIVILRDIMLKSVIKAMGLERAFISMISKNIDLIRDSIGKQCFVDWLAHNIEKIKENEFAVIAEKNMNNAARRNIVEAIKKVVDAMDV